MENNNPANETTNQQEDNQQVQLTDLPVEKSQETNVQGGLATPGCINWLVASARDANL